MSMTNNFIDWIYYMDYDIYGNNIPNTLLENGKKNSNTCKLCIDGITFPRSSLPVPIRWVTVRLRDPVTGKLVDNSVYEASTEG